jgi:hypothetical protein
MKSIFLLLPKSYQDLTTKSFDRIYLKIIIRISRRQDFKSIFFRPFKHKGTTHGP